MGLRPARRQEHLPSCADSQFPERGWGGPTWRETRPVLGTAAPVTPCHPELSYRPLPGAASLHPPSQAVSRAGPQRHSYLPRGFSFNLCPFPPTRPRAAARRILFTYCILCVIPELKNPLGSLLEQEDTSVPGDTPSTSHLVSPILLHHFCPFPTSKNYSFCRTWERFAFNLCPYVGGRKEHLVEE